METLVCEDNASSKIIFTKWERPVLPELNNNEKKLTFQQIDLDHYMSTNKKRNSSTIFYLPVIRLYGVTEHGNSVCCHVHGFLPYFYVATPEQFKSLHCEEFRTALNETIVKELGLTNDEFSEPVQIVELIYRKSIYGYEGDVVSPFAKITLTNPMLIETGKNLLERAKVSTPRLGALAYQTFEANLKFETRFMIDMSVVGCSWIELPAGKFTNRKNKLNIGRAPISRSQIEVDVEFDKLISHPPEGEWIKAAPFRIMSFDIECTSRKGIFPVPDKDPVIQIANIVVRHGETDPFIKTIYTLNSCAPIMEAQVISFHTERELLQAWAEFVQTVDPDIITGYNLYNFDLWYLLERAVHLKVDNFNFLGRIIKTETLVQNVEPQTKKFGKRHRDINTEGRVIFDLFLLLVSDYKLTSYKLDDVSYHYLGEKKENVHHSEITYLQNESDMTRRRLAVYCLKDALLPLLILDKLNYLLNYMELSRVSGETLRYLLTRQEQFTAVNLLLRKAKKHNIIIPTIKNIATNQENNLAPVVEPSRIHLNDPIAVLVFSSLASGIIQTDNLCYTTLLKKKPNGNIMFGRYIQTKTNKYFVKATVFRGLLPGLLDELFVVSQKSKYDLMHETNPLTKKVLNGRLLSLKITIDSVYNITKTLQLGNFPCSILTQSVDSIIQLLIERLKKRVEHNFCIKNGYAHDAKVIYADSNCVKIHFGVKNVEEVIKLGKEVATLITENLSSLAILEFQQLLV